MTLRSARIAALLLAAATALGMGRRPPAPEKTMMTIQEWKGQQGGPEAAGSEVIVDPESWKELWRRLGRDAPALEFQSFVAVAVFAGQKFTGGYAPAFEAPAARGDDLVVRFRIVKPDPDDFVTQALTQPWAVRAFARPKGRVLVEAAAE